MKPRPLSDNERELLIRRPVDRAWHEWIFKPDAWAQKGKDGPWVKIHYHGSSLSRYFTGVWGPQLPWYLNGSSDDESYLAFRRRFLFRLVLERVQIDEPEMLQVFSGALREKDGIFILQLQQIIESKGAWLQSAIERNEPLNLYLLRGWDTERDGLPPLHHFDRTSLEIIVRHKLGIRFNDPRSLEKARSRLQLPACRLERWEARITKGKLETFPKYQLQE
jgi:hypothetical protein